MDGSQLPTEWTHLNSQLVVGVSDSKKREKFLQHSGTTSKKGPMSKNKEVSDFSKMSKMTKIVDASKNVPMAEETKSGTKM